MRASVQRIQQELTVINPFIHTLKNVAEVMTGEERRARIVGRPAHIIQMVFVTIPAVDRRLCSAPIANEIAAVYVFQDGDATLERQYAIQSRGGITESKLSIANMILCVILCFVRKENSGGTLK